LGVPIETRDLREHSKSQQAMCRQTACYRIGVVTVGPGATVALADEGTPLQFVSALFTRFGAIDERFQSYDVEMLEMTGGEFWLTLSSR
jgi:hypothetical protein